MKKIKLANDKGIALVDDEDYEMLNQYKWHLDPFNYALTDFYIDNKKTTKYMHLFIINSSEGFEIDHIDNDGLNNRKGNLRIVTHQQNMMNKRKIKLKTSKYKGVHLHTQNNKWQATIMLNRKSIYIGLFESEIDAAKAYNKAAKELFGEYANLNEV